MLRRLVHSIGSIKATSGFEAYFGDIQRHYHSGMPTQSEAKRDFQERERGRNKLNSYFMGPS